MRGWLSVRAQRGPLGAALGKPAATEGSPAPRAELPFNLPQPCVGQGPVARDLRKSSNRTEYNGSFFGEKRNALHGDCRYLTCRYENNQKYVEGVAIRAGISRE